MHPELRSTYNTALKKEVQGVSSTYTGNTFYTLDTDSDIGVKIGSSMVATQMSINKYKNTHY